METIEFRLTTGKKEGTWTLPKSVAEKDRTLKPTDYFKGSSSFFVEDNENTIYKRTPVVFRYNDILNDPACNYIVDGKDKVLINYLKSHSLYGKVFKIHNEDEINQGISDFNDKIFEAFTIVNESDEVKLKSIAFAILGKKAISWTVAKCAAELKETAKKTPQLIIDKKNAQSFEAYYMSALAFNSKIVKTSPDGNDIMWNDDRNSVIIRVDKGENPIEKLADYIVEASEKSRKMLQEIGLQIEKLNSAPTNNKADTDALDAKDKEIEFLKAQLAAKNETDPKNPVNETKTDVKTIEEVREDYVRVIGKEVPARYKNDIDWLSTKIDEKNQ